ncbi:MAG: hypothetical protein ACRDSJ_12645 [Rubrobacteraceae bacterium]
MPPYYYGYGPYSSPYGYGGYGQSGNWAAVDTDVSPEEAEVFLDSQFIGRADDFDGFPDYLYLERGRHVLEFRLEGYESRTIDLRARPGSRVSIDEKLRKIPRSRRDDSYEPPRPDRRVEPYSDEEDASEYPD